MKRLKQWVISATGDEIGALLKRTGISRNYLYQLTGGHREPSAELAGKLADAAEFIRKRAKADARLPDLTRANLCNACSMCPHARACAKSGK